jgi:glycosyltransferase involved in cell wall biosynthesis
VATSVEGALWAIIERLAERFDENGRVRVVTLIDHLPAGGGAERLAAEVAARLDPDRYESVLCVSRAPKDPAMASATESADLERLHAQGLRVLPLGRSSTYAVWNWRPLLAALREQRVDVLHAHKHGSNIWGSLLGRIARTPVVLAHEHTWSFEGNPMRRFLDRNLIARLCDRVIAVSRDDRRKMIELEGIPPDRVEFVPLGIDALAPPSPDDDLRLDLGIDAEAPVIGAVGRLTPQKGLPALLEAARILRPSFPDLRVLIVGEGELRGELEESVARFGLGETVTLTGFRADIPNVLASLDVAVLSSEWEGSPLAVLEYMDAACPIVATRVGGVPDLIEDGVEGRLVPTRDPSALSEAVGSLLRDRRAARRLGEAARDRRRREFTIQNTVRRIEALYDDLLSASQRAPERDAERG